MTLAMLRFDWVDYFMIALVCFGWGFLMAPLFNFSPYAATVLSLIGLLIICAWRL